MLLMWQVFSMFGADVTLQDGLVLSFNVGFFMGKMCVLWTLSLTLALAG